MIHNEAGVKAAVKKILKTHGWFVWMPPANAFGKAGIADIHALKDGVFLAVETKFGNNKPSKLQSAFLGAVDQHGGKALVVNEKNLVEFEQLITSLHDGQ